MSTHEHSPDEAQVKSEMENFSRELEGFITTVERRRPLIQSVIPNVDNTLEKLKSLQVETKEQLQVLAGSSAH